MKRGKTLFILILMLFSLYSFSLSVYAEKVDAEIGEENLFLEEDDKDNEINTKHTVEGSSDVSVNELQDSVDSIIEEDYDNDEVAVTKKNNVTENTMYQIGDEGPHIVDMKENLVRLGFASWTSPSARYGTITARVVEDLQSYYGLPVTGIADEVTLAKMVEILNPPYQDGDRGEPIVELKEKLVQLGFASWSNPSLNYGAITADVVKDFQEHYGLPVTGIADQTTIDKLNEILSSSYREGDEGPHIVDMKENLVRLGFASWTSPSARYGTITARVVEDFQSYYGLPVTGIADEVTLAKMVEILNPPYQDGDRGEPIVELKEKLVQLGFASWSNPSLNYGAITADVVKDFQEHYGLPVTGIADQTTIDKLNEILSSSYREGDEGPHIVDMKENLVRLGFASWTSPSARYGTITARVVEDFQSYYGLPVTGIADEVTLAKMVEILNPPYQDGDRGEPIVELKEKLVQLGFASWSNPSLNYGAITADVVKDFQEHYGLPVTGIADQTTIDKLNEILSSSYREGDEGPHIVDMKENLVRLGFASWTSPSARYGTITARVVEDFQSYYGLPVTGIADEVTLAKMVEILNPPYQDGDRGEPIVELKEKLVQLGFASWSNPSLNYGAITADVVKDFQIYYGLSIDGVAGEDTLEMLEKAVNGEVLRYEDGDQGTHIVELKEKLVQLGFANWSSPSPNYGSITSRIVEDFQSYYGLPSTGIVDINTLKTINDIITGPYTIGDKGNHVVKLKENLVVLGFASWSNPSENYGEITANVVKDFQEVNDLKINGIVDSVTLEKINELVQTKRYVKYSLSFRNALDMQMKVSPQTDLYVQYVHSDYIGYNNEEDYYYVTADTLNVRSGPGTNHSIVNQLKKGDRVSLRSGKEGDWYRLYWVDAKKEDVSKYLDPSNFINDQIQRFQFLDLSRPSGATARVLDNFLKGKGTLDGQGEAFIDAGLTHGINDVYLISHAILETGNGGSTLSKGVEYNGVVVYNMFGINAFDHCPIECGAKKAYEEGWTSPYKAIVGGASFIGNGYIKQGQNTLYKMRWNPEAMESNGAASHQYATDIGWASKQVTTMFNIYQQLDSYILYLEIPEYK